jgi:hypothetical protein
MVGTDWKWVIVNGTSVKWTKLGGNGRSEWNRLQTNLLGLSLDRNNLKLSEIEFFFMRSRSLAVPLFVNYVILYGTQAEARVGMWL